MTPRRNDPRFGPDDPSTPPEPDREAAGDPGRAGADPGDDEDDPQRADRLAREEAEDAEFDAAIKAIVSSGLIAGPDPGVVEEILGADSTLARIKASFKSFTVVGFFFTQESLATMRQQE